MTVTSTTPVILLLDKIMTITNLTILVPVKLDIDEMNYSSWVYFFKNLCKSHEILKHILAHSVYCIEGGIVFFKLGDLSIDAYFHKIDSIDTILTSPGSPISNDDAVTIVLEGLPDKYDNVFGIIVHREPFPDLKMVRFMLTTEEMRLKSRAQASPIDSTFSSPLVLLANGGNSTRRPNVALEKGVHGNTSLWSTSNVHPTPSSTTTPTMIDDRMALIQTQQALLAKLGYNDNNNIGCLLANTPVSNPTGNTTHVALHTSPSHTSHGSAQSYATYHSPPGQPSQATNMGQSGQLEGTETIFPNAFNAMTLHDPTNGNWNMDT
ncbi:hypothetical protein Tco_1144963 [Tanacetum coccineum]